MLLAVMKASKDVSQDLQSVVEALIFTRVSQYICHLHMHRKWQGVL
jgi:hypothetical protein